MFYVAKLKIYICMYFFNLDDRIHFLCFVKGFRCSQVVYLGNVSMNPGAVKNISRNRDFYLQSRKMFPAVAIHPRRPESGSPAAMDYFYR